MLLVALAADERSHGRAHHLSQAPRAPARRIGQAPGDPHPLPRPNRATWAGSPAASWPIAPKPNAPSNSPNTWAGQRRRHGAGHHLAVATQSLHPPRPGHARAQPRGGLSAGHGCGQPPRRSAGHPRTGPVFVALNPGALPAREQSPAELYQWIRREEQYATLGANVVVELNSESHARRPHHPRLGDHSPRRTRLPPHQRPSRPWRAPAGRPDHPQRPHQPIPPTPRPRDGCRCPLIIRAPRNHRRRRTTCNFILISGHGLVAHPGA